VLLLIFLLFRVAAGDPARAVLGKNPSPKEVEEMRLSLSSSKPLFWGYWRTTEIFSSADFENPATPKGVRVFGRAVRTEDGLKMKEGGAVSFARNFDDDSAELRMTVVASGKITISALSETGRILSRESRESDSPRTFAIDFASPPAVIKTALDPKSVVERVSFQRRQKSPFDSQFAAAIKEIVSFSRDFPYVRFLSFGRTLITREPVSGVLRRGILPSLSLMIPIFVGELFLGVSLALIATAFRNRWPDKLILLGSITGMSVSYVVLLILGQWFLGYYFNWFPVWGYGSLKYLALPVLIGVVSGLGGGVRFYRTIFIDELGREYLRTAEAKGCGAARIYFHHLLRNAAVPLIARVSAILPFLFTGSLLLESFFGIPGLGYAGINALRNSDLQMVKALVILTALIFVAMNLLADITYAWADPRMRLK
ncbi:MAG: ABC transporter permease, partial [Kiritimatiellaeota bacterium]|nr:ABC transporter permease [Kiritimatiellota bacterium]